MSTTINRPPRVFLDIQIGTLPAGRITIELFADKTPKTCENFRALATSSYTPPSASQPLSYKQSPFHRIIDEFMVQGGDITKGDGTGGASIYGGEFEDENIGWREIDRDGLVCMANRGKGTNSSQFFITLAPSPHLNGKHTVFGHVVAGQQVLEAMAKVPVDKNDRPLEAVLISHCGELEPRGKKPTAASNLAHLKADAADSATPNSSRDRGRKRRRRSMTDGPSRSTSRTRSRSLPRHHHHRGHHHKDHHKHPPSPPPQPSRTPTHRPAPNRRRSDISLDGTRRGRTLTRSPSTPRPANHDPDPNPPSKSSPSPPPRKRHHRNRSRGRSPSRSRSASHTRERSASPHLRRQHTRSRSRSVSRVAGRRLHGEKGARGRHDHDHDRDRDRSREKDRGRGKARAREEEEEEEDSLRRLEEEREGGEGRYSGVLAAEEGEGGEGVRWRRERRGPSDWGLDEWGRGRRWDRDGGNGFKIGIANADSNGRGGVARRDREGGAQVGSAEVKFKGRGSMKYRERKS